MILQLKDIHMSFTNAQNETFQLLRGVNLTVEEGKITALVGGNGTGKTTLFNIISGFEKDYTGDVVFEGNNFNRISAHRISLMGIGRLFQDGQLLPGLTLMENMKMASDDETGELPFSSLIRPRRYAEAEKKKERQAVDILKRIFGEDCKYLKMLNDDASAFSYGEQRLLSLARLLMGGDRLLLLDEPTSGVNPVYIDTIEKMIREMVAEGLTVLLIEHNMQFVRKVAHTCAYLDDGVIVKVGPTAEVLDDKNVRNSYLGL
jgi:ABC-type branched-subunit amino acid transport system ATPase component